MLERLAQIHNMFWTSSCLDLTLEQIKEEGRGYVMWWLFPPKYDNALVRNLFEEIGIVDPEGLRLSSLEGCSLEDIESCLAEADTWIHILGELCDLSDRFAENTRYGGNAGTCQEIDPTKADFWICDSLVLPGGHNSLTNQANERVLEESELPFTKVYGEWGVQLSDINMSNYKAIIDAVPSDYPIMDDMYLCEIENEAKREAWDNWLRREATNALETRLKRERPPYSEDEEYKQWEDVLFDLDSDLFYQEFMKHFDGEFVEESNGSYFVDSEQIDNAIAFFDISDEGLNALM